MKVLHSICRQTWKTQQWPQDWKRSVFIPIPKKGNAKECSNYRTITLISLTSKVKVKVRSLSGIRLFPTPWTAAYQAPLSMGFSRQEYWSGLPLPSLEHSSKVMLKFSKPSLSNMRIMKFQMFKVVLEKADEPEIKLSTSTGLSKKQESSREISISALLTMPKPLTMWITTNCGKF